MKLPRLARQDRQRRVSFGRRVFARECLLHRNATPALRIRAVAHQRDAFIKDPGKIFTTNFTLVSVCWISLD